MATGNGKVRYAVVGMGWFAQSAVLPAFANAGENSVLTALFSGNAEKRQELAEKYQVPAFGYEEYERILASGALDAVYIVTPNSEHHDFTVQAAERGIHVLCEKPLADTAAAAEEMIAACEQHHVKLMTAYRLHFEKANLAAVELARSGQLGEPRLFESVFTQVVEPDNTRMDPTLGGSPLLDMGIYCINAARYLFQAEPEIVQAFAVPARERNRRGVPDMISALMRFPENRVAMFTCGFGQSKVSMFRLVGTKGDLRLEPAYSHAGALAAHLTLDGKTTTKEYPPRDQVGPEIIYFSDCILRDGDPEPDGVEGLLDLQIIEAIEAAAEEQRSIALELSERRRRPSKQQQIQKPAAPEAELVKAKPPGA